MSQRRSHRSFVSYMDRSREYYSAQGYRQPYAWAHHDEVTFTPLKKPLSQCRVGLVTTADKAKPVGADEEARREMRQPYAEPTSPAPTRLYTEDLFWDKKETHTDDVDSFLPLRGLADFAAAGRIGSVSPRFYGVPTSYSQGRTVSRFAPQILGWCRADGVDAVLLSAL
jgi:D-proline reductase (dithiol) PrdB